MILPRTPSSPPMWLLIASLLAANGPRDSLLVTPAWLAEHLADPQVIVLHIGHNMDGASAFARGHIPGARELDYMRFTTTRDSLSTELPPFEEMRTLFEGLGISDDSRVVVHADEAPMATRAILTLHLLGVRRAGLLDGGLARWKREGRPISTAPTAPARRGRIGARAYAPLVVDAEWIQPRLGRPGTTWIDTRTDEEYLGTGGRRGMPSDGHLAGARQVEWEELFSGPDLLTLRPATELARLFSTAAGDTVVTYCWVGYRASATWFAATLLGYDARFYDGSYQDWRRRGLPVSKGSTP